MNKEEAYDTLLFPIVNNIISICEEHNIPFFMSFSIPTEECSDLMCSSRFFPEGETPKELRAASAIVLNGSAVVEKRVTNAAQEEQAL